MLPEMWSLLHHKEVEKNIKVKNKENVGQEEEVQVETICIPIIYLVLDQHIMSFFKGLC